MRPNFTPYHAVLYHSVFGETFDIPYGSVLDTLPFSIKAFIVSYKIKPFFALVLFRRTAKSPKKSPFFVRKARSVLYFEKKWNGKNSQNLRRVGITYSITILITLSIKVIVIVIVYFFIKVIVIVALFFDYKSLRYGKRFIIKYEAKFLL